ncbi:MAG: pantoate--beta-alanine ligase [Pseudomonadota bacterium]
MKVCKTVPDIRRIVAGYRSAGHSIGLVTTMGALHAGHMALITAAQRDHPRVVATIFVNPTQFGETKDFATYPSDIKRDIDMLQAAGVDALFLPDVATMYPDGDETIVETTQLANVLHGQVRPGHFRGVATVVARLFNITLPDAAYFGEKDYQQLQVIRCMVRDLHFPLSIHAVPTVRDPDGLAMSSRNARLSPDDRRAAPILHHALKQAAALIKAGITAKDLYNAIRATIAAEPRATVLAIDIVTADTLAPINGPIDGETAILLSAQFGDVLLIDQKEVTP